MQNKIPYTSKTVKTKTCLDPEIEWKLCDASHLSRAKDLRVQNDQNDLKVQSNNWCVVKNQKGRARSTYKQCRIQPGTPPKLNQAHIESAICWKGEAGCRCAAKSLLPMQTDERQCSLCAKEYCFDDIKGMRRKWWVLEVIPSEPWFSSSYLFLSREAWWVWARVPAVPESQLFCDCQKSQHNGKNW